MDPVLPCQPCGWVAVLRPHAASAGHVTKATYSYLRGVYVRHGTKHVRAPRKRRTSENAVKRKFAVFHKSEVQLRRILIPRRSVNKGRKKGQGLHTPALNLCYSRASSGQVGACPTQDRCPRVRSW